MSVLSSSLDSCEIPLVKGMVGDNPMILTHGMAVNRSPRGFDIDGVHIIGKPSKYLEAQDGDNIPLYEGDFVFHPVGKGIGRVYRAIEAVADGIMFERCASGKMRKWSVPECAKLKKIGYLPFGFKDVDKEGCDCRDLDEFTPGCTSSPSVIDKEFAHWRERLAKEALHRLVSENEGEPLKDSATDHKVNHATVSEHLEGKLSPPKFKGIKKGEKLAIYADDPVFEISTTGGRCLLDGVEILGSPGRFLGCYDSSELPLYQGDIVYCPDSSEVYFLFHTTPCEVAEVYSAITEQSLSIELNKFCAESKYKIGSLPLYADVPLYIPSVLGLADTPCAHWLSVEAAEYSLLRSRVKVVDTEEERSLDAAVCKAFKGNSEALKKSLDSGTCGEVDQAALRYNHGKVPMGYVLDFPLALAEVCKVMEFGAQKYARDNWKKGLDELELYDSALRHLFSSKQGTLCDEESGCNHLAHAAWNLLVLLEQRLTEDDIND